MKHGSVVKVALGGPPDHGLLAGKRAGGKLLVDRVFGDPVGEREEAAL
jgi:hypothetical protein